jgi:hypothetical protein
MAWEKWGWMLVVTAGLLTGCVPSDNTDDNDDGKCVQDTDCATGQRCEKTTGECVAAAPPQDRNLTCTVSADCRVSEICHPTAKVCVQTCRASSDCPDTAKACDVVSATVPLKVCHCATDTLCGAGRQRNDLVCSNLEKVCTPRCVTAADCGTGRTCDAATGQCAQPQPEPRNLRCQQDTDCLASELCHPSAKVCVQSCMSSADCPDEAKNCEVLSAADTRRVCKCSTDELCNFYRTPKDLVCSVGYNVCTPRCTADTDCGTNNVCDTASGSCQPKGPEDSTGKACTGEGLSTCDYGKHTCDAGRCTLLPAPTCDNYTRFPEKDRLGTTGRILYNARVVGAVNDTDYCPDSAPKRVKITFSAYANVPFPPTRDGLSGLFFVRVDGTVVDAYPLIRSGSDYVVMGANRERAEITLSLCVPSSSTTLSTAFYFIQGNFLCHTANY